MDRNLNTDNFERLLREKSDEFKMYPSKRVWHSVYNNLHPGRRWPSVTMCIALIATLLLVGYLNTDSNWQHQGVSTTENTTQNTVNTSTLQPYLVDYAFSITNYSGPINEDNTTVDASLPSSAKNSSKASSNQPDFLNSYTKHLPKNRQTKSKWVGSIKNKAEEIKDAFTIAKTNKVNEENTGTVKVERANSVYNKNEIFKPTGLLDNAMVIEGANKLNSIISSKSNFTNQAQPSLSNINIQNDALVIANSLDNSLEVLEVNKIASNTIVSKAFIKTAVEKTTPSIAANVATTNTSAIKKDEKTAAQKTALATAQKDWIENYALYNRPTPKKWAGKLSWQVYATPSIVYRKLYSTDNDKVLVNNTNALMLINRDINSTVQHKPSVGLEIGTGFKYNLAKRIKVNAGLQLNYTRYNVHAYENSHPNSTSLTLIDTKTNWPYEIYRSTPYTNSYGLTKVKLHNETYQLSIPLGIDFKLTGSDNIEWYAGTTIQPTLLLGGKSNLLSTDRMSYVNDASFLNRFNMSAGFETFIAFKADNGITWQIGPQIRTQLFTTNSKIYTISEKLVTYGIKIGISKKF